MSAAEALRLARESGVRVVVSGADLILDAEREPEPAVLESVRRHKAEIVALLQPAEWREGVAQLGEMVRPARIRPDAWRQIVADAVRFLRDWGTQASSLGWTTPDIFGGHPTHPVERIDCAGLVLLLRGAEVVAISDATICTRNRNGARLTYRRRPLPDSVPLWRLK